MKAPMMKEAAFRVGKSRREARMVKVTTTAAATAFHHSTWYPLDMDLTSRIAHWPESTPGDARR